MKVGDLVQLTEYGNTCISSYFRDSKYGIILNADEVPLTGYDRYVTYRIRWFDRQGKPMRACVYGFTFIMLKSLNKNNNSSV